MNTSMKVALSRRSVGLSLPLAILTVLGAAVAVLLFALSSPAQAAVPVTVDDDYTINEDNPLGPGLDGGGGGVLSNDIDSDGDNLNAILVDPPSHGHFDQFNQDGSFLYIPAPNFYGADSFTYMASDGNSSESSNVATVHIDVLSVNDPPSFTSETADVMVQANSGTYSDANWATSISAGPNESQDVTFDVANNNPDLFSDQDHQPAVSPDGTLTFTPKANATGSANVIVTAKDDGGTANGGIDTSIRHTFTITVTPPPPELIIDSPTFKEGDSFENTFFTLRLSEPSTQPVTVVITSADDSATAGEDYQGYDDTPTTFSFEPGFVSVKVFVPIIDDTQHEDTETFFVDVSSSDTSNPSVRGVGTILDNDPAPETTAPTVISTYPSNDGTMGKADLLTATFSEEVKGVSEQSFYLKKYTIDKKGKETYVPVAAKVTTPNGITAVLNPTKDLAKGTYQATITNGVTDKAGNALVPKTWSFKVTR